MHKLHIALPVDFSSREGIADMAGDNRLIFLEQLRHLSLTEPGRFSVEVNGEAYRLIRRLK